MTSWWRKLFVRRPITLTNKSKTGRARLGLERLEDRTVPANFSIAFDAPAHTVGEGAGSAQLTLVLTTDAPLDGDVKVDLTDLGTGTATSGGGGDYSFTATTLTFPAGSTTGTTQNSTVTISDDRRVETTLETAQFAFHNIVIAGTDVINGATVGTHTLSITDNDSASVAITTPGTTSVTEGGGTANVQVTLTLTTTGTGPVRLGVPLSPN